MRKSAHLAAGVAGGDRRAAGAGRRAAGDPGAGEEQPGAGRTSVSVPRDLEARPGPGSIEPGRSPSPAPVRRGGAAAAVYLWESYAADIPKYLKLRGVSTHRVVPEFDPERLCWWAKDEVDDFNQVHPDKPELKSHDFRKRAVTEAHRAGLDVDTTAAAVGMSPSTARAYYFAMDQEKAAAELAKKLAATLRPHRIGPPRIEQERTRGVWSLREKCCFFPVFHRVSHGFTEFRAKNCSIRWLQKTPTPAGAYPYGVWFQRGRRDSNPQPPDRQSGTLTN